MCSVLTNGSGKFDRQRITRTETATGSNCVKRAFGLESTVSTKATCFSFAILMKRSGHLEGETATRESYSTVCNNIENKEGHNRTRTILEQRVQGPGESAKRRLRA